MLVILHAALSLLLPPLPDMASLVSSTNWMIPGRLKMGDDVRNGIEAPTDLTLKALSALVAMAEPQVRAGNEIVYVYGANGSADLVCACLLAQLYQLSAEETP